MPQVPYNPVPTVAPSGQGISSVGISSPPAAFGENIGQATSNIARALSTSADEFGKNALQFQNLLNESAAKDGDVQVMEDIGKATVRFKSLEGQAAVDAYPAYQKEIESIRQKALSTAPNLMARQMLDQSISRRVGFAIVDGASHAAQQGKVYANQASAARVDLATQSAAQSPDDDAQFNYNLKTIAAEQRAQAELHGSAPEVLQDNIAKAQGKAWAARLSQLSINNPLKAQQLYLQNKDSIDGVYQLQIEERLRTALNNQGTRAAADAILAGHPVMATDKHIQATIGAESDGRPDQISRTGARGIMQVEPNTGKEVAKQLGIPFDADRLLHDNEYNKKIGTTYLNNMLQRYGGNKVLASAAYNAGPAKVDAWLKTIGDPRSGIISNEDWAKAVPIKETRDYLQHISDRGGFSGQQAFDPAKGPGQLTHFLQEGNRIAEQIAPGDAQFKDMMETRIRSQVNMGLAQYTDQTRANKEIVENSVVNGMLANHGATLDQLVGPSADPKVQEAFQALPPQNKQAIYNFVKKSQNEQTIGRVQNYQRLVGESVTDRDAFLNRSMTEEDLTLGDMKTLINRQAAMRKDPNHNIHVLTTIARARDIIADAGLHESVSDPEMAKRYTNLVGAFSDQLDRYSAAHNNRPPDDAWVRSTVSSLVRFDPGSWLHWTPAKAPLFERDIPKEDVDSIVDQYSKQFGQRPSDAQIRQFWLRAQMSEQQK